MREVADVGMRLFGCLLGVILATTVGAFTLMEVGEGAFAVIDEYAPGYFAGRYAWAAQYSGSGFDAPRKMAWGDLLAGTACAGGVANGLAVGFILLARLGGVMSVVRAYLIILLSGLAGGCLGGGVGWTLGRAVPGYYRGIFQAGGEPWFDPVQVGVGLGISQGLLTGLAVGGVTVVVVAWYRVRAAAAGAPKIA